MNRDSLWTNSDGLVVGFGPRDVEYTGSATVSTAGARKQVVARFRLSDLGDALDTNDLVNAPVIPAGALLEAAKLYVYTAAAGVNAVLDIGIATAAGADVNDAGIDAAIATATLVEGYDTACDGALVGTKLANNSKVYASYDTAAFTAGVVTVVIDYIVAP